MLNLKAHATMNSLHKLEKGGQRIDLEEKKLTGTLEELNQAAKVHSGNMVNRMVMQMNKLIDLKMN